jgi:hypothetical protein
LGYIQKGHWENRIDQARAGDYSKLKLSFPCFIPSGVFAFRHESFLLKYSGLICLDYDKLESVYNFKKRVCEIPTTYAAFFSPSLKGVKVFIKTDATPSTHEDTFKEVNDYYKKLTGIESDPKCKNIARLCYVSHDQDCYLNTQAAIFTKAQRKISAKGFINELDKIENYLFEFTAKSCGYPEPGNRNNYLFQFACNANRYGVDRNNAADMVKNIAGQIDGQNLTELEVKKAIENGYKYTNEFSKFSIPRL